MSISSSKIFQSFSLILFFFVISPTVFGQNEKPSPTPDQKAENTEDEALNIETVLIQTGVAVFDKKGQFINNLKQEDFELLVDGKSAAITFFEPKTVGKNSTRESKPAENKSGVSETKENFTKPFTGRNIIFVIDDFHLSFDSTDRARKLIKNFIEQEMLSGDTVAVVSPSGKIGFLEQFTDDKTVLLTAAERLIYTRDRSANDRSIPPMTEYEALLISQYDRDVTDIFAAQEFVGDPESKREAVRMRARSILTQAAAINRGTYSTLEQAVRRASVLSGRKIVFFVSDGLLLDPSNTDSGFLLERITDAAARTNTVIYSLDAKGLEAGFPEDGTTASSPSVAYRVQSGERLDRQDGLSLVADKTGGKFIKNTNDLQTGLNNSIREASQYYLLAWEPADESGKSQKLRKIEVRVKNRPELTVRVQGGYLTEKIESDVKAENKNSNKRDKKNQSPVSLPEKQLNTAVNALIPVRQLPTALAVNYLDASNEGALLAAVMQVNGDAVEFAVENGKAVAGVDIVGIVYNSEGKREGYFRELINSEIPASNLTPTNRSDIYYNYQTTLKPGLYQVRVAARDVKSGRVGSAVQWIEIPDLTSKKLTLGSLIVSEQTSSGKENSPAGNPANADESPLAVSVDRVFNKSSRLRYLVFIYNAAQKSKPDVTIRTQVFRGKTEILSSGVNPVSVEGRDAARLPYAAEIPLESLLPGFYDLQVTVQDRHSKIEAAKRVSFEIR